jgi:hypothetical protein
MEQRLLKFMLIQLKVAAALLLAAMLGVVIFSFRAPRLSDDFWSRLGLGKEAGTEYIGNSFLSGYLTYYGVKSMKNIAVDDRTQIVRDLGAYAKQYVNSEKFKKLYTERRENLKPTMPKAARSASEIRDEQVKAISASIATMEEFLKSPNADLKKVAQEGLPGVKKQLKELQQPDNELIRMLADAEKLGFEHQLKQYNDNLAKWEQEQPIDPKNLIVTRLRNFLSLTADIDFNAGLTDRNGKKIFVNSAYEQKSDDWKRAFRAGKETVTAAREFAQQWLKELQ